MVTFLTQLLAEQYVHEEAVDEMNFEGQQQQQTFGNDLYPISNVARDHGIQASPCTKHSYDRWKVFDIARIYWQLMGSEVRGPQNRKRVRFCPSVASICDVLVTRGGSDTVACELRSDARHIKVWYNVNVHFF